MSRVAQKSLWICSTLLHPQGSAPELRQCRAEDGRLGRAQRQRRCQRAEAWPQAWQRRRSSLRHRSRTATVQGGAAHRRLPARRRPRAPARAPATRRTSWSMPWEIPSRGRASRTRASRRRPTCPTGPSFRAATSPATSASARCSTGCCARTRRRRGGARSASARSCRTTCSTGAPLPPELPRCARPLRPPAAPPLSAAPRSSLQLRPRRRAQGGEARHAAPRPTPHAAHLVVVVGRRVGAGGVHVPAGGPPPTR